MKLRDIAFGGWFNDGTVIVYVGGVRYVYEVDTMHHHQLKSLSKHRPFSALNQIKDLVKAGKAKQIPQEIQSITSNLLSNSQ